MLTRTKNRDSTRPGSSSGPHTLVKEDKALSYNYEEGTILLVPSHVYPLQVVPVT